MSYGHIMVWEITFKYAMLTRDKPVKNLYTFNKFM